MSVWQLPVRMSERLKWVRRGNALLGIKDTLLSIMCSNLGAVSSGTGHSSLPPGPLEISSRNTDSKRGRPERKNRLSVAAESLGWCWR